MEKALFPAQLEDDSFSQVCKVVCLVKVSKIFCVTTDKLPTPGVLPLCLIPDHRISVSFGFLALGSALCGCYYPWPGPFVLIFNVPNDITPHSGSHQINEMCTDFSPLPFSPCIIMAAFCFAFTGAYSPPYSSPFGVHRSQYINENFKTPLKLCCLSMPSKE